MGAQLRAPVLHPSVDRRPPRGNYQLGGRRSWNARAATKLAPVSCSAVLGGGACKDGEHPCERNQYPWPEKKWEKRPSGCPKVANFCGHLVGAACKDLEAQLHSSGNGSTGTEEDNGPNDNAIEHREKKDRSRPLKPDEGQENRCRWQGNRRAPQPYSRNPRDSRLDCPIHEDVGPPPPNG
jgi:hypothetical protein